MLLRCGPSGLFRIYIQTYSNVPSRLATIYFTNLSSSLPMSQYISGCHINWIFVILSRGTDPDQDIPITLSTLLVFFFQNFVLEIIDLYPLAGDTFTSEFFFLTTVLKTHSLYELRGDTYTWMHSQESDLQTHFWSRFTMCGWTFLHCAILDITPLFLS